jgi:hypothetical protein
MKLQKSKQKTNRALAGQAQAAMDMKVRAEVKT